MPLRTPKKIQSADLSGWDTSAVTDMGSLLSKCSSLVSLDLNNWDTSAVTGMELMFAECSELESLDLSKWGTSAVTEMVCMFQGCSSLTSLDLSNWDTAQVTSFGWMFDECNSLSHISYTDKCRNILSGLPKQSGWYLNNEGPYSISTLPELPDNTVVVLIRTQEVPISSVSISGVQDIYPWTADPVTPEPVLTINGKQLIKDQDYSVIYTTMWTREPLP